MTDDWCRPLQAVSPLRVIINKNILMFIKVIILEFTRLLLLKHRGVLNLHWMRTETHNGQKALFPKTKKQWRQWLVKNHRDEKCVWLIFYRQHSKTQGIGYVDAVEEALCFGWIDSVNHKRDERSEE